MTGEGDSRPSLERLGSYRLIRPIAQGGMADIYLAKKDGIGQFERHVALKVLNSARATDAESCAMFLDEARLVAMLNHQNIATVFEVDVAEGHHYLAMEYVHGADLRELLATAARAGRTVPYEVSLSIVAAAAAGLDHAHRRCGPDGQPLRLVHRDVSLSNIMVAHDGAVKVVDFGIASTAVQTVHTSPGVVRGKASYMSPEQCLGDEVDHRTDVFALGIVLYELTTGARCFSGKTDFERMLAVVRGEFHRPTAIVANYPPELEHVICTALASHASQRYQSCAQLIEALQRVALGRGWMLGTAAIERLMRALHGRVSEPWATPSVPAELAADVVAGFEPEPTAKEAPSARRAALEIEATEIVAVEIEPAAPARAGDEIDAVEVEPAQVVEAVPVIAAPTERSGLRLARGTNADGFATELDDDLPTRGRRPLPRRPSTPNLAA